MALEYTARTNTEDKQAEKESESLKLDGAEELPYFERCLNHSRFLLP